MLFDTHAHLVDEKFDLDIDEVVREIKNAGVGFVMNPGCCVETSKKAIELSEKYDFIYAGVGIHPHDADSMTDTSMSELEELCRHEKVKAIGEIGFDYHYEFSSRENQRKCFEAQLELAKKVGLPVMIHDREAHKDTMDMLKLHDIASIGGVMHCYSGSVEMMREVIKLGMYVSIAGPVTYKNSAKLPEVAKAVPSDRLLIETDCPYLTPEPLRGKRNDPSKIVYTAQKIAELRGISLEELAEITTANAKRFYNI